jgi:hypothetical protein
MLNIVQSIIHDDSLFLKGFFTKTNFLDNVIFLDDFIKQLPEPVFEIIEVSCCAETLQRIDKAAFIALSELQVIAHHPSMSELVNNKKLTEIAEAIISITECENNEIKIAKSGKEQKYKHKYQSASGKI